MKKLVKLFLFLIFGIMVFSCNNDKNEDKEETALQSGILSDNMDTNVNPGDDFHAFVNGKWMRENEIPADKASYGAGYMVHERAEEAVKEIIIKSAEEDFPEGSAEQKVGDLYTSYMNMEHRDSLGTTPLQEDLAKIDAISNYEDLARYFAYANKTGLKAPLGPFILQNLKNPKEYTVYIGQSGLGLPDRDFYTATDARSKEIRAKYLEHIQKMYELAEWPNGQKAAQTVLALETKLAEKQMKKEDLRNPLNLYNPYAQKDLDNLMPDFDISAFMTEAQVNRDSVIVAMVDYTKALNKIITSTPLETWKTYLKWGLLNSKAGHLTSELDNQNFAFYSKELSGTQEQREMWRRGVNVVNNNLGEVVGKVYVEKHFPPRAKERMEEMVKNLKLAYKENITKLDWMGDETKKQALDKLEKINTKIGYPEEWRDYSNLTIAEDDLYGNLKRSVEFEYQRQIDKLDKPIDKKEWAMNPQTVNAYYNALMNEIVFPAAILQPPFFNLQAEDAVNYGAIGAVIGHEIGHGFDDQGSRFDGDGTMRNWWTDTDRTEFEKRTKSLIGQYNEFEAIDSVFVNGEFTLGENIGDLGGLGIAYQAYLKSLDGKEGPVLDGYTAKQRVFIGYAQAWLSKSRDEAIRMQINTDPHSPAKYRVNGVVRNIPAFYEAFEVSSEDSLFLPEENRVRIW